MKKLLLTLGAVTAVVAPVASVVACGNGSGVAPGKTGSAAIDISDATTIAQLGDKLQSLKNTFAGQEGTKDAMRINIKNGSDVLDVTITKEEAQSNTPSAQAKIQQVKDFFKKVLTAKGLALGSVDDLASFLGGTN